METVNDENCEPAIEEARLSPWAELLWPVEWAQLRLSSVYGGAGIAAGHGEPVIVVPGLLGTDLHTRELRRWLARAGYEAHASGIGRNVDCPDESLERLERTVTAVVEDSGQRVRIVGHSLGGMLARAAAVRNPDLVSQVITLGSPLRDVHASPIVLWMAQILGRLTLAPSSRARNGHVHDGACACALVEALAAPFPGSVMRTSVFSRRDGIVDWQTCVDASPGQNVEVHASHLGMLVSQHVYQAIAQALATTRSEARRTFPKLRNVDLAA